MRGMRIAIVSFIILTTVPHFALYPQSGIPPHATRCNLSIPIDIDLTPLDRFQAGRTARFRVRIESDIDPGMVEGMWVDYEIPQRLRPASRFSSRLQLPRRRGRQDHELGIAIPDRSRYQIRARLKVRLSDGTMIARTAVRYVDAGGNPPEGMIGRLVDSDGTGIRIYQGQTRGE